MSTSIYSITLGTVPGSSNNIAIKQVEILALSSQGGEMQAFSAAFITYSARQDTLLPMLELERAVSVGPFPAWLNVLVWYAS